MSEQAKRVSGFSELDEAAICYWKADGVWLLYIPACGVGNLARHEVAEHADGTITALGSVRMTGHKDGAPTERHGFLERGVWREA